ncbi:MAG: CDP-glycerol glycerophosphotransferase family protein [Leucobacter sp.]
MSQPEPLFTVVLSMPGDSPRTARAIAQVLDQDIDFGEHAELVIIRTAPTRGAANGAVKAPGRDLSDSAKQVARFPERVTVTSLDPESDADDVWTLGNRLARGRYITFISANDQFDLRTLSGVREFVERFGKDGRPLGTQLPVVAVPLVKGLGEGILHSGFAALSGRGDAVDLTELPGSVPTNLAGLFIDTAWLRERSGLLSRVDSPYDEPLRAIELIDAVGYRIGYVEGEEIRLACGGRIDPRLEPGPERRRFDAMLPFFEAHAASENGLNPALRSSLVCLLKLRLARAGDHWFADEADQAAVQQRVRALLQHVPPKELHASPWLRRQLPMQYLLASYLYLEQPWSIAERGQVRYRGEDAFSVSEFPVTVMRINTLADEIEIEALFLDYFSGELDLRLVSKDGETVSAVESASGDDGPAPRAAGRYPTRVHYRRFVVPATAQRWRFAYVSPSFEGSVPVARVEHHAKTVFSRDPERRRMFADGYRIDYSPKTGYLVRRGTGGVFLYKLRRAVEYACEFRRLPWSVLASSWRKSVILINDRAKYGNDNGEALFRHIQQQRPDLKRRTWFVLDEEAPSYRELARTGRVVQPLTFKHRVLYLNARLHFSSHVPATYNSPWRGEETSFLSDFADPTFVWLRHGVTMNSVDNIYNRFNANLDGIVASAGYEARYLTRPGSFFTERSLVPSGLPRFDRLGDTSEKQKPRVLLYMPTWRKWLAGRVQPNGSRAEVEGFAESDYFLQQQRLLTDPEILAELRAANARIEFLIHPVMTAYQEHYERLASKQVAILDPATTSYAELFARGAGMITDYSSVFVDFSYMRKPVIFDQSDVARFRGGHYSSGLFDYATQAPGPVLDSFDELKRATVELIRSGFEVSPEYAHRLDDFFLHGDQRNSARALEGGIRIDERRRGKRFTAR